MLELGLDRVAGRHLSDPGRRGGVEVERSFVRIVRAAAQLDVVDRGLAAHPVRLDVVKLQEAHRGAAAP